MKMIINKIKSNLNTKLIKFAVTGSSGLLIDMYITWFLKEKLFFDQYIAHVIGFMLAVVNNYLLNKYWTFKDLKDASLNQFLMFLAISSIGLCLNTLFLYMFVTLININFYVSKVMSVFLVFIWNYGSNSFLTFRKGKLSQIAK